MKRVTLDDIAKRLNLSTYSVSRALAGKSGVSEDTRLKVVNTARLMGYTRQPQPSNDAEEEGVSTSVALLIPSEDVQDSEFWMGVISGASSLAEERGYPLTLRSLTPENLDKTPQVRSIHGVLAAGSRARPALEPYLAVGIPAVLITYPRPLEELDSVTGSDWEGGSAVAEHLLSLGHRKLAFVTEAPDKPSFSERARGYRETINAAGSETVDLHVNPAEPSTDFEQYLRRHADKGDIPTAIFASTDGLALSVMVALFRFGLRVPEDVSVVGSNDSHQAQRFNPALTTLRIPKREIGRTAMDMLYRRMTGEDDYDGPRRRISFPPKLIIRSSSGPRESDV